MSERSRPKIGKPQLKLVGGMTKKEAAKFLPEELEYFRSLHQILDEIFEEAANSFGWTWSQLSVHSGLSYETVRRLGDRETRWPRYYTVHKLAKAVGWSLTVVSGKKAMKKVSKIKLAAAS